MPTAPTPVVLAVGGHDPVGGAGIQADIEAITAQGGHAATAITCLTVQDTRNVRRLAPVDADLLAEQIEAILADLSVATIKIGLIGEAGIGQRLAGLLARHPAIPVVLDPVLAAGGGANLTDEALRRVLLEELLPRTTLLTPNSREARELTGRSTLDDCARALLETGCRHVLITGGHEAGTQVLNALYDPTGLRASWSWERLSGEYHGSGCTLAAACAALLARGLELETALRAAQEYTWQTLAHARRLGHGQILPNRLFRLSGSGAS